MWTAALVVTPMADGQWCLVYDLIYKGKHDRFVVPTGFCTDFASVPRLFWALLPPTGKYTCAAVLHDFFYRTSGVVSRKDADGLFLRIMLEDKTKRWRAKMMWVAVRMFGWRAWVK